MVFDFVLTQFDNNKRWSVALTDDLGPVNLSPATSVTLNLVGQYTGTIIQRAASINPNPQTGLQVPNVCYYTFLSADTTIADTYAATWLVVFSDGTMFTFPDPPAQQVLISAALT